MKLRNLFIGLLLAILLIVFPSSTFAAKGFYRTGLTGGASTDVDGIDGDDVSDLDMIWANVGNTIYFYTVDADSAAAEDSPQIIAFDTDGGDKRAVLLAMVGQLQIITVSTDTTLTIQECKNTIILVTGAYTVTLPAVSEFTDSKGGSLQVRATTAATFHIDPNGSDLIELYGTDLDDGDKITSPGVAGAFMNLINTTSAGWATAGAYGIFVDGG